MIGLCGRQHELVVKNGVALLEKRERPSKEGRAFLVLSTFVHLSWSVDGFANQYFK